jgi:predicted ester cyclase
VTLVPLDATNDVPVTMEFYRIVQKDHATPAADFVFQALTSSLDFIQSGGYWFWDSLAAVVSTEGKNVVAIQGGAAHVIVGEGAESGRTILGRGKGTIRAAYHADREKFEQIFLNVLNGRDPYAALQPAAVEPGDPDANKAIVRRYFEEGWGGQNSPAIDELVDRGYVSHGNSDDFAGNLDSLKTMIASFHQLAPDMTVRVDHIIAEGDTVAAQVVITGTHTGDIFNLKPTNKPIIVTINSMVSLSDGKIVEEWQTFDTLGILVTIGVIPQDILSQLYNAGS